jgi:hypothetical protein
MADQWHDRLNPTASDRRSYTIARRHRYWEVRDAAGVLVCLTVYKRGAQEVVRRMSLFGAAGVDQRPLGYDARTR